MPGQREKMTTVESDRKGHDLRKGPINDDSLIRIACACALGTVLEEQWKLAESNAKQLGRKRTLD